MSSPQIQFTCECDKVFKTKSNLLSHKRRHCRLNRILPSAAPFTSISAASTSTTSAASTSSAAAATTATTDEGQCPICRNSFSTYMGMRQHMRLQHPVEYNETLQAEGKGARKLWTVDEENTLARAEAEFNGEGILNFLVSISTRTKDAIKKRRQTPRYAEKVQQYRSEFQRVQQETAERVQQVQPPEHQVTQRQLEMTACLKRDSELIEVISNIDRKELDDIDVEFIHTITSCDKIEVQQHFDRWCDFLLKKFGSRTAGSKNKRTDDPADTMMQSMKSGQLSKRKRRALEYKLAQYEFKRDKTAYARTLLDGAASNNDNVSPDPKDIETAYREIFGANSREDKDEITHRLENLTDMSHPIVEDEIQFALKTSKTNTAGPDGMKLMDVRRIPVERLMLLFNSIIYLEYIPRCFNKSRTVLIPKTSDDLHMVNISYLTY